MAPLQTDRLLALDIATNTGWKTATASGTWNLRPNRGESEGMRVVRFKSKVRELIDLERITIVVYERPGGRHKPGTSLAVGKPFDEYQKEAMRTASGVSASCSDNLLMNGAMGLCGESGEFMDLLKKNVFQGHELDKEHMAKELGDILWYLAVAAEGLDKKKR